MNLQNTESIQNGNKKYHTNRLNITDFPANQNMLFMWNYAIKQITLRQKLLLSEYYHVYHTESPVSCISGQDGTYKYDDKLCVECNKNEKKISYKTKQKRKKTTKKEKNNKEGGKVQGHTPITFTHLPWTN